jgi:hypothetical protein
MLVFETFGVSIFMWAIFSVIMLIGTLRTNKVMIFVFASLTLLFVLLGLGEFTSNLDITHVAGWVGIICGASAIYLARAEVLNEVHGRVVAPIFPVLGKAKAVHESEMPEISE